MFATKILSVFQRSCSTLSTKFKVFEGNERYVEWLVKNASIYCDCRPFRVPLSLTTPPKVYNTPVYQRLFAEINAGFSELIEEVVAQDWYEEVPEAGNSLIQVQTIILIYLKRYYLVHLRFSSTLCRSGKDSDLCKQ